MCDGGGVGGPGEHGGGDILGGDGGVGGVVGGVGDTHGLHDVLDNGCDVCIGMALHAAVGEIATETFRLDDGTVKGRGANEHTSIGGGQHTSEDEDGLLDKKQPDIKESQTQTLSLNHKPLNLNWTYLHGGVESNSTSADVRSEGYFIRRDHARALRGLAMAFHLDEIYLRVVDIPVHNHCR